MNHIFPGVVDPLEIPTVVSPDVLSVGEVVVTGSTVIVVDTTLCVPSGLTSFVVVDFIVVSVFKSVCVLVSDRVVLSGSTELTDVTTVEWFSVK